jgi:hypothetical protein
MTDFDPQVFGRALTRLWPNGDGKIPDLIEGIIKSAQRDDLRTAIRPG